MSYYLKTLIQVFIITIVSVTLLQTADAQRITPEDSPDRTESSERDESSSRLILPEEIKQEETEEQETVYNRGKIEQLKADSAAMRIEFEETISQLRSDSAAMRKRYQKIIQELQGKINSMREEIERLRAEKKQATPQMELPMADSEKSSDQSTEPGDTSKRTASQDARFNPNTASLEDLESIPGLSSRLAERIEWYRREVRPFQTREDLRRVPGVDRQVFEKISRYFHKGSY